MVRRNADNGEGLEIELAANELPIEGACAALLILCSQSGNELVMAFEHDGVGPALPEEKLHAAFHIALCESGMDIIWKNRRFEGKFS